MTHKSETFAGKEYNINGDFLTGYGFVEKDIKDINIEVAQCYCKWKNSWLVSR